MLNHPERSRRISTSSPYKNLEYCANDVPRPSLRSVSVGIGRLCRWSKSPMPRWCSHGGRNHVAESTYPLEHRQDLPLIFPTNLIPWRSCVPASPEALWDAKTSENAARAILRRSAAEIVGLRVSQTLADSGRPLGGSATAALQDLPGMPNGLDLRQSGVSRDVRHHVPSRWYCSSARAIPAESVLDVLASCWLTIGGATCSWHAA